MTDDTQQPGTDNAVAAWIAQYQNHAHRLAAVRPANKDALFDALACAGITRVVVQFDGSGDSGQIEFIDAFAADAPVALPSGNVELAEPVYCRDTIEVSTLSLRDAIEKLAYDFLEETHCGWENNDGAFGDFAFDVGERTITLAYNERRMETDYSGHVF